MRKDKSFRQAEAEAGQLIFNDLCSTCNTGSLCTSKKSRQGAVWFCEEFDNYIPVKAAEALTSEFRLIPAWNNPDTVEIDSVHVKGLCINCENCGTCNFLKPDGGVWHCEEYR